MSNRIMVGCDLHDASMLLKVAQRNAVPEKLLFPNTREGRDQMIADLHRRAVAAGNVQIVFLYEACNLGFSLYDELTAAGIICHVVAPTRVATAPQERRNKTDEKDAQRLFELLRGHVLAGNALPNIWVPPPEVRDDRELLRARMDVAEKLRVVRNQIRALFKRNTMAIAQEGRKSDGVEFHGFLYNLVERPSPLRDGTRTTLVSLLRQVEFLEDEKDRLDKAIKQLGRQERHETAVKELRKLGGVGVLTALLFLAELGDPLRFRNRRQLAAYVGLAPSANESGERSDCKGHITRQGSARLRALLCQAVWARTRCVEQWRAKYQRRALLMPNRKKVIVVGLMRILAIEMWHVAKDLRQGLLPAAIPDKTKQSNRKTKNLVR